MGKVTRKRYGAEFKAKVALEAIRGELTLAELAVKHGIHQTMIAAWKRQAIEGMSATLSGKTEAAQTTSAIEVEKLHAKSGSDSERPGCEADIGESRWRSASWWSNAIFCRRPPVDEFRAEAVDGRARTPACRSSARASWYRLAGRRSITSRAARRR